MTIIKGSDGSWTWNGGKEGAQRFDELAQAEALAKFDELGELCWLQKNPEINEDTWDEYVARVYESLQTHKGDRAARTCWKYDNWDYNYVQAYIRSIGKVWYVWLVKTGPVSDLSKPVNS